MPRADDTGAGPGAGSGADSGADSGLAAAVRAAVRAEVAPLIDELRRFVDRRISELSAEVDGAVQLADISDARLAAGIGDIHAQIATLVAMPAAATRNSGIELEAVVQATEAAAGTILEAAEAIQDFVSGDRHDATAIQGLSARVNAIFEACSFQDITGQRIRRAIQHLRQVETALQSMLGRGAPAERLAGSPAADGAAAAGSRTTPDLAQDAVDALLDG